jgi:2,3-bisphosphoglycerate-independent phosphoglycerate mutase
VVETEKYAHVTFFFNGGREEPFAGEDRTLIPSPKVSTYDLKPEMSVSEVADAVVDAVGRPEYAFVLTNLAPPDMVGHTGNYEATVRAVKATDAAVQKIYAACQAQDVTLIVTADHGNAEQMTDAQGHPHTAHTCSPVPLIVCQRGVDLAPCHSLPDVAPLILQLMGIPIPSEMAR